MEWIGEFWGVNFPKLPIWTSSLKLESEPTTSKMLRLPLHGPIIGVSSLVYTQKVTALWILYSGIRIMENSSFSVMIVQTLIPSFTMHQSQETTNQTSIDGRTIDEFHRSISRLKLVGWLLVPEAILRGSVRITWLATWPIKKLLNIYARGPAFREGEVVSPFNTVNLYPLMSKLLGINPRPNNGSIENVTVVLRQPPIRPIRRSSQFEAWVRKVQHFFWIK